MGRWGRYCGKTWIPRFACCFPAGLLIGDAILHNGCDTWNISAEVFPKGVSRGDAEECCHLSRATATVDECDDHGCHSEPAKHGEESPADGADSVQPQGIPLRASPVRNDKPQGNDSGIRIHRPLQRRRTICRSGRRSRKVEGRRRRATQPHDRRAGQRRGCRRSASLRRTPRREPPW